MWKAKIDIWVVYGDYDFQGGFSEIYYTEEQAFARVAQLLEIEKFDGRWDGTPAGEAYENGKWKCLECGQHTIEIGDNR